MSEQTTNHQNDPEASDLDPAKAVEGVTVEVIDRCMGIVDEVCRDKNFDASAMIFMSVNIAAHLMARGLFCANGPEARANLKVKMVDNVAEILESAAQHIDQSERELSSKIIRPN